MDKISIALGFDNRYCTLAAGTIASIIEHASDKYSYDIYIFHYDISEQNQQIIKSINSKDNIDIKFRFFDFENLYQSDEVYLWGRFTKIIYYVLFIDKLLPNLEKVLCLDTDMIITSDLVSLYNTDITEYALAACVDLGPKYGGGVNFFRNKAFSPYNSDFDSYGNRYNYYTKYVGLNDSQLETYFNAGVLLFNIKKSGDIYKKKLSSILNKKHFMPEQDKLNYLFREDKLIMDERYNVPVNRVPNFITENHKLPDVIHYLAVPKPIYSMTRPADAEYWKTIAKTDYFYPALDTFINQKIKDGISNSVNDPHALDDLLHNLGRIKALKRRQKFIRILIKPLVNNKKYMKLKKRPVQFFNDSKSTAIRFLGKFYF